MSDKTGIQWTQSTWNPVVGCSPASPGCTNCYAMGQAARIQRMTPASHYADTTREVNGKPVWTGVVKEAPERILLQPLRWKRPRLIFVNSMSDLFHESVPDAVIDRVFAVMALAPQHTFQCLTKRLARMRAYLTHPMVRARIAMAMARITAKGTIADMARGREIVGRMEDHAGGWPLSNVWLGVSTEDQRRADERVPDLLATPAAVRFVSAEPLLGGVDFPPWLHEQWGRPGKCFDADGQPWHAPGSCPDCRPCLDWMIVGGESGPGARPMHPQWARDIRDQCAAAGVAYFFKQHGAWAPVDLDASEGVKDWMLLGPQGELDVPDGRAPDSDAGEVAVRLVGKARAGRLLDGREHNAMPEVRA